MASSNKHWPSMFKSKPCNSQHHHHRWQHDIDPSLPSTPAACQRLAHSSAGGCEERGPEPKPRWNPKPEQIRILEGIFNSGMVNPPRDEIRKIRAQLQEYGQVGDANVFYWFQNRKSRTKHKLQQQQRHLIQSSNSLPTVTSSLTPPSSSSSSSDSPNNPFPIHSANVVDISNSPTTSLHVISNQTHFPITAQALDPSPQPFHFPAVQLATGGPPIAAAYSPEFCFPGLSCASNASDPTSAATCSALFLTHELMSMDHIWSSKKDDDEKMDTQQWLSFNATTLPTPTTTTAPTTTTVTSPVNHIQDAGVGYAGAVDADSAEKSTVFINDVAFEVNVGPFNVREAFGERAVLVHSSGHPVLTDEWGVTHHPLQHGAFYYLVRS